MAYMKNILEHSIPNLPVVPGHIPPLTPLVVPLLAAQHDHVVQEFLHLCILSLLLSPIVHYLRILHSNLKQA